VLRLAQHKFVSVLIELIMRKRSIDALVSNIVKVEKQIPEISVLVKCLLDLNLLVSFI